MLDRLFSISLGMLGLLLDEGLDPQRLKSSGQSLEEYRSRSSRAIQSIGHRALTVLSAMMIILLARGEVLEGSPLTAHQERAQR